jgi:hypothetical protein
MTKNFRIQSGAVDTIYEASDEEHAVRAFYLDAGYYSIEDAAGALGRSVEDLIAELIITEVDAARCAPN